MGWRNFLQVVPFCQIFGCGRKWFLVLLLYLEYNGYMMGRRNRYFKGTEDGQMTPPGYPSFNSYVKNLRVLVFQTDGQTDRQTDGRRH
jgi:hypothetical protein